MYTKKKQAATVWVRGGLLVMLLLAGCSPSGPEALLDGKRLLDRGQPGLAVRRLREAVSLMPTNATAWGYLGVAYHQTGNASNAVSAYSRTLTLNPELGGVRFSLGCLWMQQGEWVRAREQFAAATVIDSDSAQAWRWLGEAEMRLGDSARAVRCLGESLRLDAQNPDAWNWLGMAQLKQGRLQEAERSFQSALRVQANHGPAILNLAILNQEKLKNPARAIELYRQYLAFFPGAANASGVKAVLAELERVPGPAAKPADVAQTPVRAAPQTPPTQESDRPATSVVIQTNRVVRSTATRPAPAAIQPEPAREQTTAAQPMERVSVTSRPPVVRPVEAVDRAQSTTATDGESTQTVETDSTVSSQSPPPEPQKRRGFFAKINPLNLFKKDKREPRPTPLPERRGQAPETGPALDAVEPVREMAKPSVAPQRVDVPNVERFSRYAYRLSGPPQPGDRQVAEREFAGAETFRRRGDTAKALRAYERAVRVDPSHFAAQFNLGLIALEEGNLPLALAAFEAATRIRPDSAAARYNFSLALKSANYPVDSANELLVLLAYDDGDPRVHLTLGNLYAQQFGDKSKAREHYLRVLELDPGHPQAGAINFWLVENPQ
jgi:tetratricopeptide (TPR) repeat protein